MRPLLSRLTWTVALLSLVGGAGCFFSKDEADDEGASSRGKVTSAGDTSAVLKSTLVLDAGCVATKIGPKLLLTAARCTQSDAFAKGKSIGYVVASTGAPAPALTTADASAPRSPSTKTFTLADVKVHTSFDAKCAGEACAVGKTEASDASDIAVLVLDQDLETVPALPVDLDAVGEADPLLVVSSGCSAIAASDGATARAARSLAVPARAVGHEGSAYAFAQDLVTRLAGSYVVSAGVGWDDKGARLCRRDLGAPIFRAGAAAVAGVTSTYTTVGPSGAMPVTVLHTRVDAQSRFKIGAWLSSLGAATLHSCSENAGGCVRRSYDGGMPEDLAEATATAGDDTTGPGPQADGGAPDAASAPDAAPTGTVDEQLPPEDETSSDDSWASEEDYGDAAVAPKKSKKKDEGGCSAAPGGAPTGGAGLGLAVAVALAAMSRRRR